MGPPLAPRSQLVTFLFSASSSAPPCLRVKSTPSLSAQSIVRMRRWRKTKPARSPWKRGVALSDSCRTQLEAAETRVDMLIRKEGKLTSEPFRPEKP